MPPNDQDIPRRISFVRLGLVILVLVGLGTLIWAIFFRSTPANQGTVATNTPSTSQTTKPPAPKPKQTSSTQQKSSSSPSSSSSSSANTAPQSSSSSSSTGSNSSSSTNSSTSGSPSTSQTPPTSSSSSSASTQQLANTGPGNTFELFAGVTAVAGIAHYVYTRKRFSTKS